MSHTDTTDPSSINPYGVKVEHKNVIDGQSYTTTLFGAEAGFSHIPMILEVASSPLGLAADGIMAAVNELKGGDLPTSLTGDQVRMACMHLAEALVKAGGASRARDLLGTTRTTRGGKGVIVAQDFDSCFQGRYAHLFKVLAWVLEVNYAPFLRGAWPDLLSRLASVKQDWQRASQPSPSDKTSGDGDTPSSASPTDSTSIPSS